MCCFKFSFPCSPFPSSTKPAVARDFAVSFAQSQFSPAAQPAGPITCTISLRRSVSALLCLLLADFLTPPPPSLGLTPASLGKGVHCEVANVTSLVVDITGDPCEAFKSKHSEHDDFFFFVRGDVTNTHSSIPAVYFPIGQ